MPMRFQTIALVGKPRNIDAIATHENLYDWLTKQGIETLVDHRLIDHLPNINREHFHDLPSIGEKADLAIVIGGDGNMLGASRVLARYDISVIGVNRGKLGFLTDLDPDNFKTELAGVLNGNYIEDHRFLLDTQIHRNGKIHAQHTALNEAVLHPGHVAHMIDFDVFIDDKFVFSQRSDGLIISTPTGSTAYNLSAGGAILSPSLDAITLVPLFPHTISSRPLVVNAKRNTKLVVSPDNKSTHEISCDSQVSLPISPGDEVHIFRSPAYLKLIHPENYSYYRTLRSKLGWSNRLK